MFGPLYFLYFVIFKETTVNQESGQSSNIIIKLTLTMRKEMKYSPKKREIYLYKNSRIGRPERKYSASHLLRIFG